MSNEWEQRVDSYRLMQRYMSVCVGLNKDDSTTLSVIRERIRAAATTPLSSSNPKTTSSSCLLCSGGSSMRAVKYTAAPYRK